MLSENRIRKLARLGHFNQLIEDIVANGRPASLAVRLRLGDPNGRAGTGLGLAIQRLTEITFAVTDTTKWAVHHLVQLQERDGSFGSIAATAVALRALFAARKQCGSAALQADIDAAIGPALDRLMHWQDTGGTIGDLIDSSICHWQLSDCAPFREAIHWHDFVSALDGLPMSPATAALCELAA